MSLYLGENLISGQATLVGESRNIGQIIPSVIPLTDAGLHLLDGSLILGGGIYSAFVDYIADLYDSSAKTSNVTKIGSLADNNGVLSGFSTSNYAKFPSNFQPGSNTWEMVFKVTTGNDVTTTQYLCAFSKGSTTETRYATRIYINASSKLCISVTYNGTAWDIAEGTTSGATGSYSILPNTTYYLKYQYTGSAYILSYSLDGESYTQDCYVASTTPMYNNCTYCVIGLWNNGSNVDPWTGSIDLKESYININGQRWWSGMQPVCFTDETSWQTSVTQYGVCSKFVYDSTNNTVRLPKLYSSERYLIDSYTSGTNWYRIYNDGWCEQGGKADLSGTGTKTINLLKAYKDLNYFVLQSFGTTQSSDFSSNVSLHPVTTSSIGGYAASSVANNHFWQTCGYIDITDYVVSEKYEYIVIATSTKTDIQVDIDEIATDLNEKVDKSSLAEVQCVVETYRNGTSWYRVYSDGWCEQGGQVSISKDSQSTVTLLKPYKDMNYIVLISAVRSGTQTGGDGNFTIQYDTVSQFKWSNGDDFSGGGNWQACGYIAVGE